jgi:hypothetical protein
MNLMGAMEWGVTGNDTMFEGIPHPLQNGLLKSSYHSQMQPLSRHDWSRLKPLQIGKYAEYFVKMECTLYGFDVYSTEVDDKSIDFVIRKSHEQYYDIQVKSARNMNYIFIQKDKFELRKNLLVAVVYFIENYPPDLFLIPSSVWLTPNQCFVSRDYEGKKSKPEWGIYVTPKTYPLLAEYAYDKILERLSTDRDPMGSVE